MLSNFFVYFRVFRSPVTKQNLLTKTEERDFEKEQKKIQQYVDL